MAVFQILGNKSRDETIEIANQLANKYDGKFDFGVANHVFIKFKTVAAEKAAVAAINKAMRNKVSGVTKKEYSTACEESRRNAVKPVPLLSSEVHVEIAKGVIANNPGKTVRELFVLVGDANHEYAEKNGVAHNALDYYQVQGEIKKMMETK